ncbi:MAG: hypothetical protein JWP38_3590 [Herbaspirillum sp.]|jgi:hypothetical protein|nr:hypothetical protein [Herbaspirillum sp.]
MSKITIVDQNLNFTDIANTEETEPNQFSPDEAAQERLPQEERAARELTSIRISGRLPE